MAEQPESSAVKSQASESSFQIVKRASQRRASRHAILLATSALVSLAMPTMARAQSDGTWLATPADGNFNNKNNWDNGIVPDGIATFGPSSQLNVKLKSSVSLDAISVTADAYTLDTNAQGLNINGAGISVANGASFTLKNNIGSNAFFNFSSKAGSATIINEASASLTFGDTSDAAGATITNHGGLTFAGTSTAGNASITSDGSIIFQDAVRPSTAQITLVQSDPKDGTPGQNGTLDISRVSTTIGSLAGDATGRVFLGSRNLTVGGNNLPTTFAGVIQDGSVPSSGGPGGTGGSLTKQGDGTLILTGANTYTGSTVVTGGALIVDGSIQSPLVTVNPGGTLGGAGTVQSVSINGGTLAPGDGPNSGPGSFGTLTVNGNLTFASGSYLVQVSPNAAASTSVAGTATLGGATVAANFAPGSYVAKQYTILTAGSIVGNFASSVVTSNLSPLFQATLSSNTKDVFLNLSASANGGGSSGTGGGNGSGSSSNVANALANSFNTAGGIPAAFALLSPTGLTQISGETAVGTQQATFSAMNQFMGVLLDPTVGALSGARASDAFASMARKAPAEAFESRWGVWGAGFGGSQTTSGNAVVGSNNTASNIFGTAVGADYRFSPNTIAGFALAGGGTHFTVDNGGSGNSDLFQAGAYVRHTQGAVFLAAALAYGWQDVTTNRTVTAFGIDSLRAEFKTNALSGRLEGGYKVATGIGDITPYAAGQFTTYRLPSYAEQTAFGASTFALNYNGKDVTASRSELGLRGETAVPLTDATLMLRGRLAWAHDFNTDRNIQATFQALPGSAFVVNGAIPAADTALTTISAETLWRNGWSASITGDAQLSDSTHSYSGKGVVRYSW
jgi:autotransporter-associated beta strand protein